MRFLIFALIVLLVLFPGSSCVSPVIETPVLIPFPQAVREAFRAPPEALAEDPRISQILKPVVQVVASDSWGSGFTFAVQEVDGKWRSFIMTAKHVLNEDCSVQVKFFTTPEITVESEVVYTDDTYDFAIIIAPYRHLHTTAITKNAPSLFTKVYAAGVAVVEVPLCNPGELTGQREEIWYVSAPSNWGYSGGPCMAYIGGQWKAVGVLIAMGVAQDPQGFQHPVYHTIVVLKMDIILEKLEIEQDRRDG